MWESDEQVLLQWVISSSVNLTKEMDVAQVRVPVSTKPQSEALGRNLGIVLSTVMPNPT